ncbi:MAG TPA: asparagine synthase (glutamine-hydrolyzing) [bacterium]|nr:asparagine synthase (glutamine-hydrolyzing) [bacterium]
MCGICGIYRAHPGDPEALRAATARMARSMAHRGPDDEGVWADAGGRGALGNRRLAIIDLSPAGHQPMTASHGDVVATYNGETYNFPELRAELEAEGHRFRGHSDTEVVLALYLRDGAKMIERLRGMFAFALWDGRTGELLLARDRLGIKPLYYVHRDGQWMFASELRAFRAAGTAPLTVDPVAVAAFLRLGSVPGPLTVYEGVRELPPATTLVVGPNHPDGVLRRYWEIPHPEPGPVDVDAAVEDLRARLSDAVVRHLISDVPLGVFLSGGLDSNAIVAMMRDAGHAHIRTFSITFPEAGYDEGAEAGRLAARYETEHTARPVTGQDLAGDLDRIIAAMDQPTVDGVNTYYVSQVTRDSGTIVALSGLGGDELFGGYPSFRRVPRLLAWQRAAERVPFARPAVASALAVVPSPRSAKLREGLAAPATIQSTYLVMRGLLGAGEVHDLLRPGPVREASAGFDAAAALGALATELPDEPAAATSVLELRGYMHNQLLRDTDVMSMAHSLEVRVPFLDHPLVEFAARLPGRVRVDGHPPKWLLTRALGDRLPPGVGRIKRGFTFPIGEWMAGPLRRQIDETLGDGAGLFQPEAVARLRARVEAGHSHWSRLWALVVLARWLKSADRPAVAV